MKQVTVVKIGGAVLDDKNLLSSFLNEFVKISGTKVLVHGGGRLANRLSEQLGIEVKTINGRRITDSATLQIAVMAYAGWANKYLVSELKGMGFKAFGISGADGDWLQAVKRPVKEIDFGYVGDVKKVKVNDLVNLMEFGAIPVCACIGSDEKGQLLNINADTIAQEIAFGFLDSGYKVNLFYCFEKAGLLNNEGKVISVVKSQDFEVLIENGALSGGILPKIENALSAIEKGVNKVWIGSFDSIGKGGTLITH